MSALRLVSPLLLIFAALPFQWVTLGQVGGFEMKLPYAAALLLIFIGLLRPRVVTEGVAILRRAGPWMVPYLVYLLLLLVLLHDTAGRSIVLRQVFFLSISAGVMAWMLAAGGLRQTLRAGAAIFLIAFFVGTEAIARSLGTSWVEALSRFFLAADLNYVVYGFFRAIFNAGYPEGDVEIAASQKNILGGSIFFALVVFRAAGRQGRRDLAGLFATVLCLIVLVMINSRSVLIVTGIGGLMALVISEARRPHHAAAVLLLKGMVFVSALFVVALVLLTDNPLSQVMADRFAFDDPSTGARVDQFGWALERAEANFLSGGGFAELNGQAVHNLFLGALSHAGIVAATSVMAAYLLAVAAWARFVLRVTLQPATWRLGLRVEWVVALPLLPLFRVWVAGDAGHPGFTEWLSLTVFFALVWINARKLARDRRDRAADAPPTRGARRKNLPVIA